MFLNLRIISGKQSLCLKKKCRYTVLKVLNLFSIISVGVEVAYSMEKLSRLMKADQHFHMYTFINVMVHYHQIPWPCVTPNILYLFPSLSLLFPNFLPSIFVFLALFCSLSSFWSWTPNSLSWSLEKSLLFECVRWQVWLALYVVLLWDSSSLVQSDLIIFRFSVFSDFP